MSQVHKPTADPDFNLAPLLSESAGVIASHLAEEPGAISDERLHQAVLVALEQATRPFSDLHVRADRAPGPGGTWAPGGTWRFNILIERSDRVLAAIEVTSGVEDLERQAFASARLSLGLGRGIAERGFLIALSPQGHGLLAHAPAMAAGNEGRQDFPAVIGVVLAGQRGPWELAIIEARRPPES